MNTYEKLVHAVVKRGYPKEFGEEIARTLSGEKSMQRMLGYLSHNEKYSMEEIADEMLAICSERDNWINKKKSEYYNGVYNSYLFDQKRKK